MREAITRREQHQIAAEILRMAKPLTIRAIALRYNITTACAESIISRFELPYQRTPRDNMIPPSRMAEENERWQPMRMVALAAAAKVNLARQIDLAKAAMPKSAPFKKGPLEW